MTSLLEGITLRIDGTELAKDVRSHEMTFPIGETGSPGLRLVMDLVADLPPATEDGAWHATYRDENYAEFIGWREIVVSANADALLLHSTVPAQDRTEQLTVYPADLGMSIPTSEATFSFRLAEEAAGATSVPAERHVAAADGSFQLWPTGVLAFVVIGLLVLVLLAANRAPAAAPRR